MPQGVFCWLGWPFRKRLKTRTVDQWLSMTLINVNKKMERMHPQKNHTCHMHTSNHFHQLKATRIPVLPWSGSCAQALNFTSWNTSASGPTRRFCVSTSHASNSMACSEKTHNRESALMPSKADKWLSEDLKPMSSFLQVRHCYKYSLRPSDAMSERPYLIYILWNESWKFLLLKLSCKSADASSIFAVRKLEQHVRRILWDILLDLWPNDIGRTLRDLAAHVISF